MVAAVRRDLKALAKRDKALAASGLAASALALAGEMDDPSNSATSKAMCARSLLDTLERLNAAAPPVQRKDKVDELASRRVARRSGVSGA